MLAVPALVVAACSSGDPKAAAPSSNATSTVPSNTPSSPAPTSTHATAPAVPTVPADVPRTGPNTHPGEKPPVMPVLATKHTPDGATAFAKFFIQTIDWGFATTSGAYMRHYFQPSCVECASHADGIDNTRKAGGHYLGGRFTITDASAGAGGIGGPHGAQLSVVVTFDITSIEAVDSQGHYKNADIAYRGEKRQIWLAQKNGGWTVVDMAPAK